MNSQSATEVRGIHGSPLLWFMAAKALVMIGSWAVEEDIFFARAVSMARVTVQQDPYPFPWTRDTKHMTSMQPGTVS